MIFLTERNHLPELLHRPIKLTNEKIGRAKRLLFGGQSVQSFDDTSQLEVLKSWTGPAKAGSPHQKLGNQVTPVPMPWSQRQYRDSCLRI